MKKINETYIHEETGIQFDIKYDGEKKRTLIVPNTSACRMEKGFVFNRSCADTIIKIGKALQEIGEFVEKL